MGVAEVLGADGKPYPVFHAAPETLSVGCFPGLMTLSVDMPAVVWRPCATVPVTVRVRRREGVGSVRLRVAIPDEFSGVAAKPVDQSTADGEVRLELTFAADAAVPPRAVVELHAESLRDGLPVYAQASLRLDRQRDSRPADRPSATNGRETRNNPEGTERR